LRGSVRAGKTVGCPWVSLVRKFKTSHWVYKIHCPEVRASKKSVRLGVLFHQRGWVSSGRSTEVILIKKKVHGKTKDKREENDNVGIQRTGGGGGKQENGSTRAFFQTDGGVNLVGGNFGANKGEEKRWGNRAKYEVGEKWKILNLKKKMYWQVQCLRVEGVYPERRNHDRGGALHRCEA